MALLHARYPELTADVNSLYGTYETEAAQVVSLPAPDYARRMIRWSGGKGCGAGLRIGMIDSALAAGLPTLAGRKLHQRSFLEPGHLPADPAHGTAIAALLVGVADPAHLTAGGLLPDADPLRAGSRLRDWVKADRAGPAPLLLPRHSIGWSRIAWRW